MKKIVVILIAFCYMLVTTGVVTFSHYCMNRLASVSFFSNTERVCKKCGMHKDPHGCCHDKEGLLKINVDHYKASTLIADIAPKGSLPLFETEYLLSIIENGENVATILANPPPLISNNPIYLRNRVFRI